LGAGCPPFLYRPLLAFKTWKRSGPMRHHIRPQELLSRDLLSEAVLIGSVLLLVLSVLVVLWRALP